MALATAGGDRSTSELIGIAPEATLASWTCPVRRPGPMTFRRGVDPAMSLFPLFDPSDAPPPQATRLAPKLRALADQGVYFGTSSWKYEGWIGSIYSRERYTTRGKFSKQKFDAECLAEYASTFPVV